MCLPVLIVDPPYVQFDNVTPGFETTFIVSVSNFGLKALDNVILEIADNGTARLEPLITFMPRLGAMETVEVPYHFLYRGRGDALPPNSIGGCPEEDLPGLAETIQGIGAILKGSTNSYLSQQNKQVLASLAVGALITLETVNQVKYAAGFAKTSVKELAEVAAEEVVAAVSKQIGCAIGGSPSAAGRGPSQPVYSTGTGCPGCFAAGTPVLMADGSIKKIEEIMVRDQCMSFSGNAGTVSIHYVRQLVHILEIRYLHHTG